ncbi:MAG TPA: thiamine pyrophosphate-binding protein [Burkholderiales bacterium]|nr:thiamine pyrophosphate-binding protein [Burkholderiales bacterium]
MDACSPLHPTFQTEDPAASSATASDLIISYLEMVGVEYVFGVPGGAVEPLYDALARSERRGGPRSIVARHEAGAAYMADGYARETGKIGVCVSTSGPGATNLITGVACAYDNDVPLLAITGQPALPSFGKGALQDSACTGVNTVGMFRHCTRYNSLISHQAQLENKLVNALMRAYQTPHGPAHLSIPVDILRAQSERRIPGYNLAALLQRNTSLVDEDAVQDLKAMINDANRIVFFIGSGCAEAIEPILKLVDLTKASFITTPDAKGLINPRHPAYQGVFGFAGHRSADMLLRGRPDLILAIGASLREWTSGAWSDTVLNDRLVHIDSSEEHLMRSPMARLHVRGSIRSVCERLVMALQKSAAANYDVMELGEIEISDSQVTLHEPEKMISDATPIKPQRLMLELSRRCPPTTRFVADAGNSTAWAIHYLNLHDRRANRWPVQGAEPPENERRKGAGWLRMTMDFAPMGWAIGAAIGIARAASLGPVVCITGDGSYLMNGQEISVAAAERLSVLFVILNDSALGMVKHGQRLSGAEPIGFELPRVDYRMQAESMGIPAHVIHGPEDLELLDFEAILWRKGPTLLDVRIDGEETPPMNLRMKTLGSIK